MIKKVTILPVLVSILVLVIMFACSGTQGEIKIGAVLPLSGSMENYGELIRNGMNLAAREINEAGGVDGDLLKIVYKDSQGKPEVATEVVYDLINIEKTPIIIGGVSSSVTLALAPICQNNKVVLLSPASSSPKLSGIKDYFFRIYPSDTLEGYTMARTVLNYQEKNGKEYFKSCVVVSSKTDYAGGVKGEFVREFRRKGKTNAVINYDSENPQFDKVVKHVMSAFPKDQGAIFISGYYTDIAQFLIELRKHRNFDPQSYKIFASASVYTPKFKKLAAEFFVPKGPEERYGLVFPVISNISPDSPDEAVANFARRYNTRYGGYPESYAAHGYDAIKLIAEVMERRGVIPQDIVFGLSITKDWSGVSGTISFDAQHDVSKYPVMYGYDGKDVFIFDPDYKNLRKKYYEVVVWEE